MPTAAVFYAQDLMRDMREVAKGLDVPTIYRMRADGQRGAHPMFAMRLDHMKSADLETQRLGSSLLLDPNDASVQTALVKAAEQVHRQCMRVLELSDTPYALGEVQQAAQRAALSFAVVAKRLAGDPQVDGIRIGLQAVITDAPAIARQFRVVYDDLKAGRYGAGIDFDLQEPTAPAGV